nr:MAG TPA: hypothetical protein [Caudoviricetes sp.]
MINIHLKKAREEDFRLLQRLGAKLCIDIK